MLSSQNVTLLVEQSVVVGGRYLLEQLIGAGGTSEVWRGLDQRLARAVAIKVLYPQFATPMVRQRVELEARAAAQLVHPAVVGIFDLGESDRGMPLIVMELLRGRGLRELMERRGRLGHLDAVRLLLPIADALALAHEHGIVHRDVKPENIQLAKVGRASVQPKLLDFGVAHVSSEHRYRLTTVGSLVGTPSYMSPEQVAGSHAVDERTDTWSLCITLYELVSGTSPFLSDDIGRLFAAIRSAPLPYPRHIEGFDGELFSIIAEGTRKAPAERPSMEELTLRLARYLDERGVTSDLAGRHLSTYLNVGDHPASNRGSGSATL